MRLSKVERGELTLSMESVAVGPAHPRWPPSAGVLPAPNNERKGLGPTLPTVFPLTEEQRHCLHQLQDC